MNNEFKTKIYKDATVYVLESATGGSTSAGGATLSKPLGKDQIVMQSRNGPKEIPASKPRNFVAKNAKMGGAGQHKDKKKAEKQGDVKHRKPFAEGDYNHGFADPNAPKLGASDQFRNRERNAGLEHEQNNIQIYINGKPWKVIPGKGYADSPEEWKYLDNMKTWAAKKSAATGKKWTVSLTGAPLSEDHSDMGKGWGQGSQATAYPSSALSGAGHNDRTMENPDWYNDEANSMTTAQLKSLVKHASKLRHAVKSMGTDTLEPWQQAKVTKAADYLDAVFNAVDDEHDMGEGNHPDEKEDKALIRKMVKQQALKQERMAEGERTMSRAAKGNEKYGKDGMKALAKAGREGASEKKLDAIRDKHNHYNEEWSQKYKSSINCSHPKGFSQKAHCAGKKKHEESMMTMEAVCPDCGMCQTHGNLNEIKKGAKDSNGFTKCWPGHHAAGTKKGKNGGQVRNCVPNEDIEKDAYMSELNAKLAEKIPANAPVDRWIKDFDKASKTPNAKGHHQFKNKSKDKVRQMAIAASYGAKNPKKKK